MNIDEEIKAMVNDVQHLDTVGGVALQCRPAATPGLCEGDRVTLVITGKHGNVALMLGADIDKLTALRDTAQLGLDYLTPTSKMPEAFRPGMRVRETFRGRAGPMWGTVLDEEIDNGCGLAVDFDGIGSTNLDGEQAGELWVPRDGEWFQAKAGRVVLS